MTKQVDFDAAFEALTGNEPFPWQREFYTRLTKGDFPRSCDIPTGLGKTSVIPIWVIALACSGHDASYNGIPRRLVYVVNRRTIVDQSTTVVEMIRNRLRQEAETKNTNSPIFSIAKTLRAMSASGTPEDLLAVSTLRGELADNQQWKFDPRCPAIIIGTVDMVGSKLLFSGYGDTRRTRPLHAGMFGCDTLFIHDEAHLTPAFGRLLRSVAQQTSEDGDFGRAPMMRVIELSATHRNSQETPLTISGDDRTCHEIQKRLHAKKVLYLHKVDNTGKVLGDKIVDLALQYHENGTSDRVVVFVWSPEDATKIADSITRVVGNDTKDRVSVLTGEIRGHERDELLNRPGMLPFQGKEEANQAVYLVATSAGEVGMDLHADQMVCDLTTLDSMIQRLGRVNRFGQTEARIDLVHEASPKVEERLKTLDILQGKQDSGPIDVCPAALIEWLKEDDTAEAFSRTPEMVELTDIFTDLRSQTSLNHIPASPEIAPWLHGIQEDQLPETWLAWRNEVSLLETEAVDPTDVQRWFASARLGAKEKLRMPTHRLLGRLRDNKGEPTPWVRKNAETPVILLSAAGETRRTTLRNLASRELNFATVVLPTELGGLSESGFFEVKATGPVPDVADADFQRVVLKRNGNQFCCSPVGEHHETTNAERQNYPWQSLRLATQQVASEHDGKKLVLYLKIKEAEEDQDDDEVEEHWLLLLRAPRAGRMANANQATSPTVEQHNRDVAGLIDEMAMSFGLPKSLQEALRLAGLYHDCGKEHDRWQIAAGFDPAQPGFEPQAKPILGGFAWRKLDGYRHELGSLIVAERIDAIKKHPHRDLILHLIAAHHGWARPHFELSAFPPDVEQQCRDRIHRDVMFRFARLQERFGHWRLAWLESLLRRADGIASSQYNATSAEEEES